MRIRCHTAAAVALITNPHFAHLDWVREMAVAQAAKMLDKDGDASLLLNLPPIEASAVLLSEIPHLVKTQKSTGLWRVNNSRRISFDLLKALAYTELLDEVLPQLRHDPYQQFRDADDWYGIAVRSQLLHTPRADEQAVKERFLAEISSQQQSDGSWEHTVIATVHHLEMLHEAGLADTSSYQQGIAFLFSCLQSSVQCGYYNATVAHDMITSPDRSAEFQSTVTYKPHWLPHIACHSHLPLIQNGYALRLLNTAGFADDPRVIQACQNLVEMHDRFGGWCVTNINNGLLAEKKARKMAVTRKE